MVQKKKVKNTKKTKLIFPTLSQKYQELKDEVARHGKEIETISKSYDTQIALLGSFANHDLKNYIHSIDGIVSTRDSNEITDEDLESIRQNISLIRQTLNDFSKLVQHSDDCNLSELVDSIRILNRATFVEQSIEFAFVEPEQNINFKIPFVSMLQLINNLVINAIKALNGFENKKIYLQTKLDNDNLTLSVLDNGVKIPIDVQPKIFDYGFSASGGSGIGLFHAQYLCKMYNGSIRYQENEYDKGFVITLPIIKENV